MVSKSQRTIQNNKMKKERIKKRNYMLIGAGVAAFFAGSIAYNIYIVNNPPEIDYSNNPATESINLEDLEGMEGVEIVSPEEAGDNVDNSEPNNDSE